MDKTIGGNSIMDIVWVIIELMAIVSFIVMAIYTIKVIRSIRKANAIYKYVNDHFDKLTDKEFEQALKKADFHGLSKIKDKLF